MPNQDSTPHGGSGPASDPKKDPLNTPPRQVRQDLRTGGPEVPPFSTLPTDQLPQEGVPEGWRESWQRENFDRVRKNFFKEFNLTELSDEQLKKERAEASKVAQEQEDDFWSFSPADMGNAALNGFNNGARSTYNLLASVSPLPSAGQGGAVVGGWDHSPFGDTGTIGGAIVEPLFQLSVGGVGYAGTKVGLGALVKWRLKNLKDKGLLKKSKIQKEDLKPGSKWWFWAMEGIKADAVMTFLAFDPREETMLGSMAEAWTTDPYLKRKMPKFGEFIEDWTKKEEEGAIYGDMNASLSFLEEMKGRFAHVTEGVLMGVVFNFAWKGLKYRHVKKHYLKALETHQKNTKALEISDLDPAIHRELLNNANNSAEKLAEIQRRVQNERFNIESKKIDYQTHMSNDLSGFTVREVKRGMEESYKGFDSVIPKHVQTAKGLLETPEFQVDPNLKSLAATRKVEAPTDPKKSELTVDKDWKEVDPKPTSSEKIFLRGDIAEGAFNPDIFWNYLKGIDPELQARGLSEVSESSQQKALMLKGLKNIYPEARLREILDTPEKIRRFLIEHEKAHIDLGHRNKYDTKDLLGKPQVGMEIEASRKALEIVKRVYGKGNLPDIRNLTVPRLKALAFELGVVSTKKGGIHKLKKEELIAALAPVVKSQSSARDIIPEGGGMTVPRNLKNEATNFGERLVQHDGFNIIIDPDAIELDFKDGMRHLRGTRQNPFTGSLARTSQLESMVFEEMNIDLDKLYGLFNNDHNRYALFLEQRQRAILRKMRQKKLHPGIALSPHNDDMMNLLMEATFDTLFSKKGHFGFRVNQLQKATEPVNRNIRQISLDDVQKRILSLEVTTKHGKDTGMGAFQKMFNEAKDMDSFLEDVISKDVFNFATAGNEQQSNRAIAAVVKLFDDQLKLRVSKGTSKQTDEQQLIKALAILQGLDPKSSSNPKLFLIEKYKQNLEEIKEIVGVSSEVVEGTSSELTLDALDSLVRKGEFADGHVKPLADDKINKSLDELFEDGSLNYGDLRTLSSRVLAMRLQIQQRGKNLIPATKRLNRILRTRDDAIKKAEKDPNLHKMPDKDALKDPEVASAYFDVLRQIALINQDVQNLATAKRSAGQTLRVFRNLDHYASLKNPDGTPILTQEKALDIMTMALSQLDQGGIKGSGVRKLSQVSEAIELASKEPSLSSTETVSKAVKTALRQNQLGFDQLNDYLISSMLSGTQTQATNLISIFIRPYVGLAEKYAGANPLMLREKHLEGARLALGQSSARTAAETRKYIRAQAVKEMFYYSTLMFDMMKLMFKGMPDTEDLHFKPEGRFGTFAPNMEDAAKAVQQTWDADHYTTDILAKGSGKRGAGGGDLMDITQSSHALDTTGIKNTIKGIIHNSPTLKGSWNLDKKAEQALDRWSDSDLGEKWGEYYNSFLFATLRQPTRKLLMFDQAGKQAMYRSRIRAELVTYAQRELNLIDSKEIGAFVADLEDGMFLPNGQRFSQQNLKNWAYQEASKMELSPEETYSYADNIVRNWSTHTGVGKNDGSMRPFKNTSYGPFSNDSRELLANAAFRKANEYTYQTPAGQIADEAHGFTPHDVPLGQSAQNQAFVHGYRVQAMREWIQQSPILRLLQPFLNTEANLWKQVGQRALFPNAKIFRNRHHQFRADMTHPDPSVVAEAKGRAFTGMAMNGAAVALVWPNMFIDPYEWITNTETLENRKQGLRINGNGPTDYRRNQTWRAAGNRPYTIEFPKEFGEPYRLDLTRFEPFSYLIMAQANAREMYEAVEHDKEGTDMVYNYMTSIVMASAELFSDKTHAAGVAEFMDLIQAFKAGPDDEINDSYWNKFRDRQLRKISPAILAQFVRSIDEFEREDQNWRQTLMKRIFPWGVVPPKRDNIFNKEIPSESTRLGALVVATNPFKIYNPIKSNYIREELISLEAALGPPPTKAKAGVDALNRMKYHAILTFSPPEKPADYATNWKARKKWDNQAKVARGYRELAKSRVAPGGEPCPIEEGESYYAHWRKYMSVRKIRLTPNNITKIDLMLEDIYQDMPSLKNWSKSVKKTGTGWVDLEGLLTIVAKGMEDSPIPAKSPIKNKKSYRLEILTRLVNKWRTESDQELMGKVGDINSEDIFGPYTFGHTSWKDASGTLHKPVGPVFWPNLSEALVEHEVLELNRRGKSVTDLAGYKRKMFQRHQYRREKAMEAKEEKEFLDPFINPKDN